MSLRIHGRASVSKPDRGASGALAGGLLYRVLPKEKLKIQIIYFARRKV